MNASESLNDFPVATPACGHGGWSTGINPYAQCWHDQCWTTPTNDLGLCEYHISELRAEATV